MRIAVCATLVFVVGCGSVPTTWPPSVARTTEVRPTQPAPAPAQIMQTSGNIPAPPADAPAPAGSLSLADLEQMAAQHNPTLAQAAAKVEAAQGRAAQAGLYPNPTVGYQGEEIGNAGTAGEHGIFVDQLVVTAGKLRLGRAKFGQEVLQAEAQALAQQYRVLNGVRMRFYELLAMRRLIAVREQLLKVAEDAVTTTEEMVNVGQANRPDLLQARIEAREQKVGLQNAKARYLAAWRQLAAFVGAPELPETPLAGDLEKGPELPSFDSVWAHLVAASPELHVARAGVTRGEFALKREQVEPVPNVNVRGGSQYNYESRNTQALAQVYLRVPLFDRNQGNIRAAQAELFKAHAEVRRTELELQKRLARTFARYETAKATVELYRKDNLPDAKEAYELYLESFKKRRAAWPQVLIALRNYFRISTDYVEALAELRRSEVAIIGLLLVDGMDEPPGPPSEGERPRREQPDPLERSKNQPILPREGGRTPEERLGSRP